MEWVNGKAGQQPLAMVERHIAEAACRDVVRRAAMQLDANDLDGFASLFTRDAVVVRPGKEPLRGVEALVESYRWGPAGHMTRHLVAGSIVERVEGDERLRNTSVLAGPDGEVHAVYRKIHMFDVDVGGVTYRESRTESPGEEVVLAQTEELPLGLTICYDLRFPELFRILAVQGARAIALPSAFTLHTGKDHWEVLVRARAIENQVFMIAAGQIGKRC